MRIFKTKLFVKFSRKAGIGDDALVTAVRDAERGLVDADLGGGAIKQRIARSGGGKSGGFRTIVLFRLGDRAVFAYGFAKNERDNIGADELAAFMKLASYLLVYDDEALVAAMISGALIEVARDE